MSRPCKIVCETNYVRKEHRKCEAFNDLADETICLETPTPFMGFGAWYEDFPQTRDEEVEDILEKPGERLAPVEDK